MFVQFSFRRVRHASLMKNVQLCVKQMHLKKGHGFGRAANLMAVQKLDCGVQNRIRMVAYSQQCSGRQQTLELHCEEQRQ